jgi:hypothetical protein
MYGSKSVDKAIRCVSFCVQDIMTLGMCDLKINIIK